MKTQSRLKTWGKRLGIILLAPVALAGIAVAVLACKPPKARPVDAAKHFEPTPGRLERGRYIVEAEAHCMHCHSDRDWKTHGAPVVPGLLGAGWDVPWVDNQMPGPVFAPNLTPDPETGLGAVPDDAVARAIREGVSHDGRALFMMPWQNYKQPLGRGRGVGGRLPADVAAGEEGPRDDGDQAAGELVPEGCRPRR